MRLDGSSRVLDLRHLGQPAEHDIASGRGEALRRRQPESPDRPGDQRALTLQQRLPPDRRRKCSAIHRPVPICGAITNLVDIIGAVIGYLKAS